ncbi:beta family protein [Luteimonas sp. FCS-9]|uniref:beta family protein n=1 Tax=Luteimonas sp. FCS-9 TaxID=1547516 RepID=UPI0009E5E864|nr:beta family protein [Luteimonas sp. FCS-9]
MANFLYVPILRWKQGEQGALKHVVAGDRQRMLPIADVQILESGVAQPKLIQQMSRSAGEEHPIGIDLTDAYTGGPVPHAALVDVCLRLRREGIKAWPTIRATAGLADFAGLMVFKGFEALIIRARPGIKINELDFVIAETRKACGRQTAIYLVLDLYAVGERDPVAEAAAIAGVVAHYCSMPGLTQVAFAAGSFPMSLGGLKPGINNFIVRQEVAIWQALKTNAGCERVVFGDYGVTNPEPLEEIDPTKMNPAAAIRYALPTQWRIIRGSGVRSKGKGGMGQYNDLCRLLIALPDYSGKEFSYGDERYNFHAQPGTSSGSYMTWRRDATSHHIVLTVRALATGAM